MKFVMIGCGLIAGRTWKVFSSKVHGDPATPIWKAYPGDRVIFRTMMPADKHIHCGS